MSLFEDTRYVYRDTFFVFLKRADLPTTSRVIARISQLGDKYEMTNVKDKTGLFESMTVCSPQDYSAMDITFVEGEDVDEQVKELMGDFKVMTLTGDDRDKLSVFQSCDVRLDVYHFEEVSEGQAEDEVLDPGGLLLVMEHLAEECGGVAFDPQSKTFL